MITFPNAKINLGLNIVEKRPDGYHNLETIFYPIKLQDALEVTRLQDDTAPFKLHVSGTNLEGTAEDNLVVKAYRLLKDDFQLPPIDIHLFKHIPTGAGLGGGSADCAFFIQNKPVFATGIGNLFHPIDFSLKGYHLVLVKPNSSVSTREAYANIIPCKPETSLLEIIKQPIETWRESMKNDFEYSVFLSHPEIAAIKDKLYDLGAVYASMSGSGSAVYGIFKAPIENVDEKFGECFCRQRELE